MNKIETRNKIIDTFIRLKDIKTPVLPEVTVQVIEDVMRDTGLMSFLTADTIPDIVADIVRCASCKLHNTCKTHVPGEGAYPAKLMMVGEAPGVVEDNTGKPFTGPAGTLLDKIIKAIGWDRRDIYITNIVKCRPPGNRAPHQAEINQCGTFLLRQIKAVSPKAIICVGATAANTLIHPHFLISKEHGIWFNHSATTRIMAIYHPAYILRLESMKDTMSIKRYKDIKLQVWKDIKKVDAYLREPH